MNIAKAKEWCGRSLKHRTVMRDVGLTVSFYFVLVAMGIFVSPVSVSTLLSYTDMSLYSTTPSGNVPTGRGVLLWLVSVIPMMFVGATVLIVAVSAVSILLFKKLPAFLSPIMEILNAGMDIFMRYIGIPFVRLVKRIMISFIVTGVLMGLFYLTHVWSCSSVQDSGALNICPTSEHSLALLFAVLVLVTSCVSTVAIDAFRFGRFG